MAVRRAVGLLLVVGLTAPRAGFTRPAETGFLDRTLRLDEEAYRYQVYVPRDFDRRREWPIILYLHGAGERGVDGLAQTQTGLGSAIRRSRDRVPAIVVFPQVPSGKNWYGQMGRVALAALEEATREFRGDRNRTYLTGISMGGYGTWTLAFAEPERFAALVPICGGILPPAGRPRPDPLPPTMKGDYPYDTTAARVKTIPAWVFHGSTDDTIPVSESRRMVEALKHAGADVRYTEYEGVGHNSWDKAYAEADLWTWLFARRRGEGAAEGVRR